MNETLHQLAFDILKAKNDLSALSNLEIHNAYREIYAELQQAEKDYVKEHPTMKIMK